MKENASVIAMVAAREIVTRARTKAFIIGSVATLLSLVAISVVGKLAQDDDSTVKIGLLGDNIALSQSFAPVATSLQLKIATEVLPTDAVGRDAVHDESIDALALGDAPNLRVVVKEKMSERLEAAFNVLVQQTTLNQELQRLGGDPAAVHDAVARSHVTIESLDPPKQHDEERLTLGFIAGLLIYLALMVAAQSIAQGVVEEKTSRVVELLLSTIKPSQLMAGKILGIGALGLLQMTVFVALGVAVALYVDALTIPASSVTSAAVWLLVWFLLGYVMYATVFAGLGALVSRQEDISGVVTPVTMLLVAGYMLGVTVLPNDPDNTLARVVSMVPVFSPLLMPMRLAIGGVPAWETMLSLALIIVSLPLLVLASARMYKNSVVRSGARVKLSDAFRAAR